MADFCRQCAIELFGVDAGDLRGINKGETVPGTRGFLTICEGCGYTVVDHMGQCIADDCLEAGKDGHAVEREFSSWVEVVRELTDPDSPFQLTKEPTS